MVEIVRIHKRTDFWETKAKLMPQKQERFVQTETHFALGKESHTPSGLSCRSILRAGRQADKIFAV